MVRKIFRWKAVEKLTHRINIKKETDVKRIVFGVDKYIIT